MGLDMDLTCNKEEINEINWLRNPFGLERWVRDNVNNAERTHIISAKVWKDKETRKVLIDWNQEMDWDLWDVTNQFCYDGCKLLNEDPIKQQKALRRLFKVVVDSYWEQIQKLDVGFLFFDLPSYRQFVEPKRFPGIIEGAKYGDNCYGIKCLMIPLDVWNAREGNPRERMDLEGYKKWFKRLVDFANDLQDLDNKFYGSN